MQPLGSLYCPDIGADALPMLPGYSPDRLLILTVALYTAMTKTNNTSESTQISVLEETADHENCHQGPGGRSPEAIICVRAPALLAPLRLRKGLSLVHLCDLVGAGVSNMTRILNPIRTCSGPVASSALLSSRILMKRGNRREIPRSSTYGESGVSKTHSLSRHVLRTNP